LSKEFFWIAFISTFFTGEIAEWLKARVEMTLPMPSLGSEVAVRHKRRYPRSGDPTF
jgi:hypothetical protein